MGELYPFPHSLVSSFEMPKTDPLWLREWRLEALEQLKKNSFPTRKQEAWRYADLSPILSTPYKSSHAEAPFQKPHPSLKGFQTFHFVNGKAQFRAFDRIFSFQEALQANANSVKEFLESFQETNAFERTNRAFFREGAYISIPGTSDPIHLLFSYSSHTGPHFVALRNFIRIEDNAEAVIVEHALLEPHAQTLVHSISQIALGKNSKLSYYLVGEGDKNLSRLMSTLKVEQASGSQLDLGVFSLNNRFVRNDIEIDLKGDRSEARLSGLSVAKNEEHTENHIRVLHQSIHTKSDQYFKAILDDKAVGVFDGCIQILKGAQHSEAHQISRNLVLSPHAEMNTKPQLEIDADDVRCSHGATVGRLDEQGLFYLRSRGIPESQAQSILTHAFGEDVISRISVKPVQEYLRKRVEL